VSGETADTTDNIAFFPVHGSGNAGCLVKLQIQQTVDRSSKTILSSISQFSVFACWFK
jgi:hypothetical protein